MSENNSFGNFLLQKYHYWAGKRLGQGGGLPSQAEFAKWLDVPPTSLSQWINDIRPPTGENLDKLADKFGIEVYIRLGVAPRMPKDKRLYLINKIWKKLPDNLQAEWYEIARNAEDKDKEGDRNEFNANA